MKKRFSVRTLILVGILLLQLSTLCFQSSGAAGDVDLSFDPGSGVDGPVNGVAVQPDGKVIIAGQFTRVKGLARRGVARLNADGSGDSSFDPGWVNFTGYVYAVALQPDGKVLVGSEGVNFGVARLNSDGSPDGGFYPGGMSGTYSVTTSFAPQPDGKMLMTGYIATETIDPETGAISTAYSYFAIRLFANGSRDTSFNPPAGVRSFVVVQLDGRILYKGGSGNGIGRLNADGSLDTSFNPGTGTTGVFALQPNGKILIGGSLNGTSLNEIARLNADGSRDGSFNSAIETTGVTALALQSDGKVLIAGSFPTGGDTFRNGIARLNADGSLDSSFDPGTAVNGVFSVALQPDGKVLIGGLFTKVNGVTRNRTARLNADGGLDQSFHPGSEVTPAVLAIAVQPDGKTLICGDFTTVQDLERSGIARLNTNGSVDGSFNITLTSGDPDYYASAVVNSTAIQSDGKVLIAGVFSALNGTRVQYGIARLNTDGSVDSTFSPGVSGSGEPIALQPDGKVLLGDVRLNSDGSVDTTFNATPESQISSVALQTDGKVLFGESFNGADGSHRNGVTRRNANGSLDSSFQLGTGVVGYVASVAVQPNGKVLAAGAFSSVNGTNRTALARHNSDGSLDGTFNPEIGSTFNDYPVIKSIAVQLDGKVLIGGLFTTVNGASRNGIARLNTDGSLDESFNPGPGVGGAEYPIVNGVVLQADGKVIVAGDFTTVNGTVRPHIARLLGDSAPRSSFASWAAGFGLAGTAAAVDADLDRDGLANGLEFILGGNPTTPTSNLRPTISLAGTTMIFTFPRADLSETPDMILTVETSTDLLTWPAVLTVGSTTAASSPGVTILENGAAADTITVTIAKGAYTSLFARLKVTIAP